MGTTRYIAAYLKQMGTPDDVKIADIEMGDRAYSLLQECDCDLDDLYEGEYLDTGEELLYEELVGGSPYTFLKQIDRETCHKGYCHVLAFVKVLRDVYPEGYKAAWNRTSNDHPDDIAFAQSLDQQIQESNNLCDGFLSTYEAIRQHMTKYHPEMDKQVDTCISWSHTLLGFAKAVKEKAMESNDILAVEFATY